MLVYEDFGSIGDGEPYIDGDGDGKYDVGETFTDENGNGSWDSDVGQAGAGKADDVVMYRITYDWPIRTPVLSNILGKEGRLFMAGQGPQQGLHDQCNLPCPGRYHYSILCRRRRRLCCWLE